jgi:hypothetical protein
MKLFGFCYQIATAISATTFRASKDVVRKSRIAELGCRKGTFINGI